MAFSDSFDNCASTVLDTFLTGVSGYGTPARVRSDHGGENVEVWRHMLFTYNDPSCVLTGTMKGSSGCGGT